ncbi:MAG: ribonuclease H [Planctomycetota bacterium]
MFECKVCGTSFQVSEAALAKYPNWTPRYCREHSPSKQKGGTRRGAGKARAGKRGAADAGPRLAPAEVLERYDDPGQDGIYTDGSCSPNPGPGGWGVVWVKDGEVASERHGADPDTTNNRMELLALIEAFQLLDDDDTVTIYSDSNLCVQTINDWAPGWAKRGWKRKSGEIANLDLVQRLYALAQSKPNARVQWIRAHAGHRWNEYADALATTWMREG